MMQVEMVKSKIHRVTVTESNLDYIGSITIDQDLMDAANILPGERVYIVDNNNGERFDTYTIAGKRGSGMICLNGAAARKLRHYALRRGAHIQASRDIPRYGHQPSGVGSGIVHSSAPR